MTFSLPSYTDKWHNFIPKLRMMCHWVVFWMQLEQRHHGDDCYWGNISKWRLVNCCNSISIFILFFLWEKPSYMKQNPMKWLVNFLVSWLHISLHYIVKWCLSRRCWLCNPSIFPIFQHNMVFPMVFLG